MKEINNNQNNCTKIKNSDSNPENQEFKARKKNKFKLFCDEKCLNKFNFLIERLKEKHSNQDNKVVALLKLLISKKIVGNKQNLRKLLDFVNKEF